MVCSFFAVSFSLPAQAWLAPRGEGTVTIGYQTTNMPDHLDLNGKAFDKGRIRLQSLTVETDYSFTDKLALRVVLPYMFGQYTGLAPHSLPVDDGAYHSTFQNFTADLRYNVSQRPVVFTPFFRLVVPSHGYEQFAHAAVGRDVREYHIGINLGRRLDPILPKAFLQAQYSYAFVQKILDISPNRSDLGAQMGYYLTPRLSLLALMQWNHTYDGFDVDFSTFHGGLDDEEFLHHDQLGKIRLLDAGVGTSFAVNRKMEIDASWGRTVSGANGHAHGSVLTLSISRTFGTKYAEGRNSLVVLPQEVPQRVQ